MPKSICVVGLLLSACAAPQGDEASLNRIVDSDAGSTGATCSVGTSTDPLVVATDKGLVKGTPTANGAAFLGIPFAKPPTGSLRLMPPEPADCWTDVADATHYGNMCMQYDGSTVKGSEDCLNLNVWVPTQPSSSQSLPVLVWMYGGGNEHGGTDNVASFGSGENLYDGQLLAKAQHAIVVSFNYRVGVLGFLAHPALTASNPEKTSGNYGLLDALLALRWVQNNISAFGGDKTHVMLFGQSAGAFDTCSLVASPLASGLFSSALMESGNCAAEQFSYQYKFGESVVDVVGCSHASDVVACLQNAPLDPLVTFSGDNYMAAYAGQLAGHIDPKHSQALPFGPTVDGYVLEDTPIATIQAGKHNHVPLVIGTNAQEVNFIADPLVVTTCAGADALVHYWFPTVASSLLAAYPCSVVANLFHPALPARDIGRVPTDVIFTCPSRRAARAAAATQTQPVYRYLWSHVTPYYGVEEAIGAFHSSEIPYVFGTFAAKQYQPTATESVLSQQMQSYWANLAATGNPNGPGLPTWAAYDPAADNALQLDTPIGNISKFEQTGCDFWDTVQ